MTSQKTPRPCLRGCRMRRMPMKGPERVTLPLMGPIVIYIQQISRAILKWVVIMLRYTLTCMQDLIPIVHVFPQPYVHTEVPCAATNASEPSESPGYQPFQGSTERGPRGFTPPIVPQIRNSVSLHPPGICS